MDFLEINFILITIDSMYIWKLFLWQITYPKYRQCYLWILYLWIFRYIMINEWPPSIQRSRLQSHHLGNLAAWCWVREISNSYRDEHIDHNPVSCFHFPKCDSPMQTFNHFCGNFQQGQVVRTVGTLLFKARVTLCFYNRNNFVKKKCPFILSSLCSFEESISICGCTEKETLAERIT